MERIEEGWTAEEVLARVRVIRQNIQVLLKSSRGEKLDRSKPYGIHFNGPDRYNGADGKLFDMQTDEIVGEVLDERAVKRLTAGIDDILDSLEETGCRQEADDLNKAYENCRKGLTVIYSDRRNPLNMLARNLRDLEGRLEQAETLDAAARDIPSEKATPAAPESAATEHGAIQITTRQEIIIEMHRPENLIFFRRIWDRFCARVNDYAGTLYDLERKARTEYEGKLEEVAARHPTHPEGYSPQVEARKEVPGPDCGWIAPREERWRTAYLWGPKHEFDQEPLAPILLTQFWIPLRLVNPAAWFGLVPAPAIDLDDDDQLLHDAVILCVAHHHTHKDDTGAKRIIPLENYRGNFMVEAFVASLEKNLTDARIIEAWDGVRPALRRNEAAGPGAGRDANGQRLPLRPQNGEPERNAPKSLPTLLEEIQAFVRVPAHRKELRDAVNRARKEQPAIINWLRTYIYQTLERIGMRPDEDKLPARSLDDAEGLLLDRVLVAAVHDFLSEPDVGRIAFDLNNEGEFDGDAHEIVHTLEGGNDALLWRAWGALDAVKQSATDATPAADKSPKNGPKAEDNGKKAKPKRPPVKKCVKTAMKANPKIHSAQILLPHVNELLKMAGFNNTTPEQVKKNMSILRNEARGPQTT